MVLGKAVKWHMWAHVRGTRRQGKRMLARRQQE